MHTLNHTYIHVINLLLVVKTPWGTTGMPSTTASPWGTTLPSREIIADSVEYMANAHKVDALVCISNCDKITPGC